MDFTPRLGGMLESTVIRGELTLHYRIKYQAPELQQFSNNQNTQYNNNDKMEKSTNL